MTRRIVNGNVRVDEMDLVWNSGLVGVPRFPFDFICIGHRHPLAFSPSTPLGREREGWFQSPRLVSSNQLTWGGWTVGFVRRC